MNVFNIIGPVMIGPSSSHTAGAVRLGRIAYTVMNGEKPTKLDIDLSGSFARTYQGHGTDRALLAGIMGYDSDSVEIRDALDLAKERGIETHFHPIDIPGAHPNTTRIRFTTESGTTGEVMGASVGGGNIRVDEVNGMRVDFNGESTTMLVLHDDVPGVIAIVTNVMSEKHANLNINNFRLSRKERGGLAIMTIEFDSVPNDQLKADIEAADHVRGVVLIRAI